MSSRGAVLLLVGVVACGPHVEGPPAEPGTARPVETHQAAVDVAPLPGPVVFFVHREHLLEPVMCCADGRCRTEQCEIMMGDGGAAQDDTGGLISIGASTTIDCPALGHSARRTVLRTNVPSRWVLPAVWPGSASQDLWWRGPITFQDPLLLAKEERTELAARGTVVFEAALVDIATIDLDDDGAPEQLITVDGRGGGVFLRRRDDRGPALVPLLNNTSPLLIGAMDLDGDRVREVLVLDSEATPTEFVVLDILNRNERLRTVWSCQQRRYYEDGPPEGTE